MHLDYPTVGLSRNIFAATDQTNVRERSRTERATTSTSANALVIEALADEGELLRERIGSLESDCEVYRLIARSALDALTDVTARATRLTAECDALRAECRFLREERLLRVSADDESAL